jgi:DnaJ-class molecular chaperone
MKSIEEILPNNIIQINKIIKLNDIYNGKYETEEIERKILCPQCSGVGSDDGILRVCKKCRGRKILTSIDNNNINLQLCYYCNGIGIDTQKHKCSTCNGMRTILEKHKLKYLIPVGVKHNEQIIVKEQGNIIIGNNKLDNIIINIQILEDEIYKTIHTKSNKINLPNFSDIDLMMELNIPLVNALCGIRKHLQHPSGNNIFYETNNIISFDNISIIVNAGLPEKNNKNIKGKLFIITKIIFPSVLDDETKNKIYSLLQKYDENNNFQIQCLS